MRTRVCVTTILTAALALPGAAAPAGLPALVDTATAATVRVAGSTPGGGFGGAGVAVGDVDGDRRVDLVVGAPEAAGTRGELYCFFGAEGGLASRDLAVEAADLVVVGPAPGSRLGVAAAIVDLDADGAGEVVATTGGYSPQHGRLASGGALVFAGDRLRTAGRIDLSVERADSALYDDTIQIPMGATLVGGDFDGDGYRDVAAGTPLAPGYTAGDRAGRIAVLFGGPDAASAGPVRAGADAASATVGGMDALDGIGLSSAVADVTGDRVDDLVIGAPNRTVRRAVPFEKAGEVFVIAGGARFGPGARIDLATDGPDFRVLGSDTGDFVGRSVSAADFTGDGLADVLAGAIDGDGVANRREPDCGEVYVVETTLDGAGASYDLYRNTPWKWVIGDAPRVFLGVSVAAGDFDGDRRPEVAAATKDAATVNGGSSGIVYVLDGVTGTTDLAASAAAATVIGPSTSAELGTVLLADDVDGDGVDDLVLGAPGAAGGRGAVFVVPGSRRVANLAPVLDAIAPISAPAGAEVQVTARATDGDGDPLRFEFLNRPRGSTVEDRGDGTATLVWTRAPGDAATYTVVVRVTDGQASAETTFTLAAATGQEPRIRKAVYKKGSLRLTGDRFASDAEVFVNGERPPVPVVYKPAKGRLLLRGSRDELGLSEQPGANRVVVVIDGISSAELTF